MITHLKNNTQRLRTHKIEDEQLVTDIKTRKIRNAEDLERLYPRLVVEFSFWLNQNGSALTPLVRLAGGQTLLNYFRKHVDQLPHSGLAAPALNYLMCLGHRCIAPLVEHCPPLVYADDLAEEQVAAIENFVDGVRARYFKNAEKVSKSPFIKPINARHETELRLIREQDAVKEVLEGLCAGEKGKDFMRKFNATIQQVLSKEALSNATTADYFNDALIKFVEHVQQLKLLYLENTSIETYITAIGRFMALESFRQDGKIDNWTDFDLYILVNDAQNKENTEGASEDEETAAWVDLFIDLKRKLPDNYQELLKKRRVDLLLDDLRKAYRKQTAKDQQILTTYYFDYQSIENMARDKSTSTQVIEVTLSRARKALRETLCIYLQDYN